MLLQRFRYTIISGIFLIIALSHAGILFPQPDVSPETVSQNTELLVMPGVAKSGLFSIREVGEPIHVPARLKFANQARTLRVFVENNPKHIAPALFVESVKPHVFYYVSGDFIVNEPMKTLHWQNNHTLSFQAILTDESRGILTLDLATLNSTFEVAPPISWEVPAGAELPTSTVGP